ncbi:ATP-binding cassette domain-containing protein [Sulfitobacter guttiformis]|uniref:ATP-binding cassette subfamily C protein LapB n=1 Tax=Sulfitobacter guttiformis TaxID=74349 RepID=A0A420DK69_9RHOB|nr:ATP-binding cassette domain-containing protein [Sulfitobacter guttiformis]KIN71577.1 putative ATP-binding/permease fusion ABC transporter [Sulfitobacter guttiformis KCTC 32187]RKE94588.1 ATP-binding cassette subfamily C protein LapB [Sulfitobacter guttiformis]
MSKPFTLTIVNGNSGRLKPAPAAESPKPSNTSTFEDRMRARAALISTYAGVLGTEISQGDLADALCRRLSSEATEQDEAQVITTLLRRNGLTAELLRSKNLDNQLFPALVYMTSGQLLLVMSRENSDLVVYDKTCPDNRASVPSADFVPFFSGLTLRAKMPIEKVEEVHKTAEKPKHWFWGQFDRFRRQLGEVALGSFVANLLAVAVALFSLQVYDRVIPHQSEATLWVLAAGAVLALLMEAFIKIARAQLMDGAGRQIELSVQSILMQRILGMRSDKRPQAPSDLFSSMREFGSVREFFTASTIGTIADIPFIFVFLFLVASIAGNVVWVLVLGGILMVIPGFFMQKRMIRLTQETQGATAKSSRLLHEAIFELDTVKTQRGEERVQRLWTELTTLSAVKSSEQRKLASVLTFWSQGVQQATYVAAVIMGTYLVFAGQFTVGSIIAVGILTSRTLAPLTQLAGTMARWGNVKSALDGLELIAGSDQDAATGRTYMRRDQLAGNFEMKGVTFRYMEEGAPTLDLPGISILQGQRIAILGANGSGKSSLLKVLSGLYAPTTGRVLIDGTEMTQIEPRDLRRLIGYLGQDVRLFSGTLRDNLNLTMLERDDARLMSSLDFAGLGDFVRNHPKGLDLEIMDAGAGLSIGQRQSIGWARLWLQDPKICLLDEPTAALDQKLEQALVERLKLWMAGRTAIIATHRAPILALTTRTMILHDGRMTIDGPKEEVMAHLTAIKGGAA